MKKVLNQRGFHIWLIPLIIVLIGIIGFTGWYVWDANKSTSNLPENTTNTDNTPTPTPTTALVTTPTPATTPATTYNDDKYGFSFDYPSDAAIKITDGPQEGSDLSTKALRAITLTAANKKFKVSFYVDLPAFGLEGVQKSITYTGDVADKQLVTQKESEWTAAEGEYNIPGYIIILKPFDYGGYSFGIIASGDNIDDFDEASAFFEQIANTIKFQ